MLRGLAQTIPGLSSAQIAVIVALGAILFVVLHWRNNAIKRQKQALSESTMPVTTSHLSVREVTQEIQALLADLEETSRRLTAQLDNRYIKLEQLMAEADERIKKLEGLPTASAPPVETIQAVNDAQRTLSRLRHERGAPPPAEDPAYAPIYTLSDQGKTSREIAQELGRQPGEIELILALRPQKQ